MNKISGRKGKRLKRLSWIKKRNSRWIAKNKSDPPKVKDEGHQKSNWKKYFTELYGQEIDIGEDMSFIKRKLEQQEEEYQLIEALTNFVYEIDNNDSVAIGVAKKIIAERSTDNLSPKQLKVYQDYILPHI